MERQKKFLTISTNEKKSENEQALEKNIEEDEKVIKELKEKKLKRKVLAEKNTTQKRQLKNVVSLNQWSVKRSCGNVSTH